jgi:ribosomal protein L5
MATITGQKALVTRSKKAIAGFKIRDVFELFFILCVI